MQNIISSSAKESRTMVKVVTFVLTLMCIVNYVHCGCGVGCGWGCCGWCCGLNKRSVSSVKNAEFELVLPCKISEWDSDKDGLIDMEEFISKGLSHLHDENQARVKVFAKWAFSLLDSNADDFFSARELSSSPFKKEKC